MTFEMVVSRVGNPLETKKQRKKIRAIAPFSSDIIVIMY